MKMSVSSLTVLAVVTCIGGLAVLDPAGAEPTQGRNAAAPPGRSAAQPIVTMKDGRLSVSVQNRSLGSVLEQIALRSGVAILVADETAAKQPVSFEIRNLPVDEALRTILRDYDAFFYYGADAKRPAALQAVWVYGKGKGRGLMPVPPELWASTKDIEQRLQDQDPAIRAGAIRALIDRKGARALDAVLRALKDEEAQVRTQALYGSLTAGMALPPETLGALLLSDPSPDIRFLALQALGDDPNVRNLVELAANDPSPYVHTTAKDLLRRWDSANLPPQPPQPVQGQSQVRPR